MPDKPLILATNDDGIDSFFLRELVQAHLDDFRVVVAAPMGEQSWIGSATSRNKRVHFASYPDYPCKAYALDGTPSDCVNIALGHLLQEQPALVISGINLGFNASLPLVYSSGTVAGALEGAFQGIPALAFSHEIPFEDFEQVRKNHGYCEGDLAESLQNAAVIAASLSKKRLGEAIERPVVWNVNFPATTGSDTPIEQTRLANKKIGTLFERQTPIGFGFKYSHGERVGDWTGTDADALLRGVISLTKLDFAAIG